MSRTSDALCTSWCGAAAGPCPAVLPSVEHHSKRAGFNCASTCTTSRAAVTALEARVVPEQTALQREARRPGRVMRCLPAGLQALLGHARLPCHRWSTAASVQASAAHRRVHRLYELLMRLSMPASYPHVDAA